MLTFIWMLCWLFAGQDPITFSPAVNDWATALIIVASIDLIHFGDAR